MAAPRRRGGGRSSVVRVRARLSERFGAAEDARAYGKDFVDRSKNEHHPSALGVLTPADVHHDRVEQRIAER